MEKYQKPEMEVEEFKKTDILTTSDDNDVGWGS